MPVSYVVETLFAATVGAGTWDNAIWDTSRWAGDFSAQQAAKGASGMGAAVAIAFQGQAVSRTAVVGFDLVYTQGGFL